jgi:Spy/CpxP family protein refolding chaperone
MTDATRGGDDMTTPVAARLGPSDSGDAKRSTLWVAMAVIAIALAGALAGVAIDRAMHARSMGGDRHGGFSGGGGRMGGGPFGSRPPSDSARRHMRERMAKELDLTPAQSVQVDSLMTAQGPKFQALREKMQPAMDSLVAETQAQMDRILTPEQREKAKAMRERIRTRRHGGPGALPGPPPGE